MERENGGNVTIYGDNNDKDDNSNGIVQNINDNVDQDIDNDADDEIQNKDEDDDKNDDNDDEDDHNDDNNDNNNDNDNDGDDNNPPADKPINPCMLWEMKHLQAFFNDKAMEYVCDTLGHMNVTATKEVDDVESTSGLTASNHQLEGRPMMKPASNKLLMAI